MLMCSSVATPGFDAASTVVVLQLGFAAHFKKKIAHESDGMNSQIHHKLNEHNQVIDFVKVSRRPVGLLHTAATDKTTLSYKVSREQIKLASCL